MLLPIGDDNPNERTPFVHYAILGANVLVFLFMAGMTREGEGDFIMRWGLVPAQFSLLNLFTSLYLHGGLAHIFGNMLFLWIAGDNVEDRLGHAGYFVFYHLAGAAASLAHVAFAADSPVPLVGASGAISGVMGAYAVFFPNSKIKIWYWVFLFFMNVVYVSAKWAVGLWFLMQVLLATLTRGSHVSYDAHIGGLLFGVGAALALKAFVLKPHDTVRRIVAAEGPPLAPEAAAAEDPLVDGVLPSEAIERALDLGRSDTAFRAFMRAAGAAQGKPVDEETLDRLGGALVVAGAYGPAARVYEELLRAYPEGDASPEAAFRLGTIQSRVFEDYLRARDNLVYSHQAHPDADRRAQSLDELRRIDAHLREGLLGRRE